MCGIAGMLAARPDQAADLEAVERFAAAMIHRGPDGEGFFQQGPVALAHRRLAIIDLSPAGRQPMFSEDGQIAIVVNGEIYNHGELRASLRAQGHVFRSDSDSEVVAHLYEEVGPRVPELLRGMFAFAIWDARAGKLLLARDRFGEKPLYYSFRADGLVFASELGALLADPGTRATVSPQALDAYLALQYVPSPATIFEEIHKLPPGHLLELRCGERPAPRRYYTASFAPTLAEVSDEEAARRVRQTVEEAVRLRLMSDVPLGAFLSGGIDSSIVVACMARASSAPVKTFSVGFSDGGAAGAAGGARADSELPYARLVAERYGTEHHELMVDPDMIALLPSIVRHHGEPFADTSAVPTRYLCEMTRRHVTVALSGDAGDEVFGGYRRYVWADVAERLRRLPGPLPALAARVLTAAPGRRARWLREYAAHLGGGAAERYLRFICHFSVAERTALYAPALSEHLAAGADAVATAFSERLAASQAADTVSRLCDLDAQTYLPDDILAKVDIASMTHGLEARAPLVDHQVVELGAALPGRLKLRGGKGKHIFKRAFADLVPEAIVNRRKKGFAIPVGPWFAGKLHGFARELLLSERARQRGLFRPQAVTALLDRHRAGEEHGERIWNLVVLETWYRELVDGRAGFMREVAARAERLRHQRATAVDLPAAAAPPG
jgi:asparagine synthase (glutamine-hydrolysing)